MNALFLLFPTITDIANTPNGRRLAVRRGLIMPYFLPENCLLTASILHPYTSNCVVDDTSNLPHTRSSLGLGLQRLASGSTRCLTEFDRISLNGVCLLEHGP